jgi:hypothetical protein
LVEGVCGRRMEWDWTKRVKEAAVMLWVERLRFW